MSPKYIYKAHIGGDYEDIHEPITAKNRKEADQKFSEMWPDITPSNVIEPKTRKKASKKK